MKKITIAMVFAMLSSSAQAVSIIDTNPISMLGGLANIEYQQSLTKTTGWTAQYAGLTYGGASATIMGGSYKSTFGNNFSTNSPSNFGNGAYWRAGLVSVTVAAGSLATGGILPVVAVGYDHKVNEQFMVGIDVGLFSNGISVGYIF
ncbi:MAG: hypothetical protein OEX12_09400 [Gammaproteobacteria bacterium]|nr:hypothetical protein [Gammaproteobacteria bacterium]